MESKRGDGDLLTFIAKYRELQDVSVWPLILAENINKASTQKWAGYSRLAPKSQKCAMEFS